MKKFGNFNFDEGSEDKIFWTISEVSEKLDIPAYVLRFWEKKFKQISPTKQASGKRLYKKEDIEIIEIIRDLLYKNGLTIKGVQKFIGDPKNLKKIKEKDEVKLSVQPVASSEEIELISKSVHKMSASARLELEEAMADLEEIEEILKETA